MTTNGVVTLAELTKADGRNKTSVLRDLRRWEKSVGRSCVQRPRAKTGQRPCVLTENDAAEYLRWKKHQEGVRTGASEIADIVAGIAAALADAAEGTARLADALRQRDSDRQPS